MCVKFNSGRDLAVFGGGQFKTFKNLLGLEGVQLASLEVEWSVGVEIHVVVERNSMVSGGCHWRRGVPRQNAIRVRHICIPSVGVLFC